jgi:murein L,D-transpeptidase YcbB/YkuD
MTTRFWITLAGSVSLSAMLAASQVHADEVTAPLSLDAAMIKLLEASYPADGVPPVQKAESERSFSKHESVALARSIKDLIEDAPQNIASGKVQTLSAMEQAEKAALIQFYEARDFHPLWINPVGLTEQGHSLVERLSLSEDDGLDQPATLLALIQTGAPPTAALELALSRAAITYAREARGGRVDPSKLSKSLTPKLDLPQPHAVLMHLAQASKAGEALWHYNPSHRGYQALRAKLAEWRETTASLNQANGPRSPDGKGQPALQLNDFLVNMERWRWLPVHAGESRIEVNIPEFTMRLYENGVLKHTGRVVVGKTNTQTPVFSSVMDHVVINPSWGVPDSILKKEFLPKLAADPDYAERHGYQVIRRDDRIVGIRQPPGERNALGFIKFMFPNEHAVYLHDTPQRNLFARDERAFSHGCVRVDQPFALADALLGSMGYDEARLKAMIGKGEKIVTLQTKLPVHLTYFTVSVDENGQIHRFADLYGHDEKLRTALLKAPQKVLATRR